MRSDASSDVESTNGAINTSTEYSHSHRSDSGLKSLKRRARFEKSSTAGSSVETSASSTSSRSNTQLKPIKQCLRANAPISVKDKTKESLISGIKQGISELLIENQMIETGELNIEDFSTSLKSPYDDINKQTLDFDANFNTSDQLTVEERIDLMKKEMKNKITYEVNQEHAQKESSRVSSPMVKSTLAPGQLSPINRHISPIDKQPALIIREPSPAIRESSPALRLQSPAPSTNSTNIKASMEESEDDNDDDDKLTDESDEYEDDYDLNKEFPELEDPKEQLKALTDSWKEIENEIMVESEKSQTMLEKHCDDSILNLTEELRNSRIGVSKADVNIDPEKKKNLLAALKRIDEDKKVFKLGRV